MSHDILAKVLLTIMPTKTGIITVSNKIKYLTYSEEDRFGRKIINIVNNDQTQLNLDDYEEDKLFVFDFVPLKYSKEHIQ